MPILLMALLALLIFGLIGILLAAATMLEHSKRKRSAKSDAAPGASGVAPTLNPKLR